jgi:hypothetical protein
LSRTTLRSGNEIGKAPEGGNGGQPVEEIVGFGRHHALSAPVREANLANQREIRKIRVAGFGISVGDVLEAGYSELKR